MAFLGTTVSFQYNNTDEDSVTYQVDKTGFDALRLRALKKALAVSCMKTYEEVDSTEELPEVSNPPVSLVTSTPLPKPLIRRPRKINRLPVITSKGPPCLKEDEERLIINARDNINFIKALKSNSNAPKSDPPELVQESAQPEPDNKKEAEAQKRLEEEEKLKVEEENKRLKEEEEKRVKEEAQLREKKKEWINEILACQKKYTSKYQELHSLVLSSKDHETLRKSLVTKLLAVNSSNEDILQIIEKCKTGNITQEHVDKCKTYCTFIGHIVEDAETEITALKAEAEKVPEAPRPEEKSEANPEEELTEKKNEPVTSKEDPVCEDMMIEESKKEPEPQEPEPFQDAPDSEEMTTEEGPKESENLSKEKDNAKENPVLVEYARLQEKLKKLEDSLKDFINDTSLKTFKSDCRKAVSTPVNAISPSSEAHLLDKYRKLSSLLEGKTVSIPGKTFTASSHPLGKSYCLFLLSKKFVEQGLEVVSKQKESAFPIAAVAVALWMDFPELGELLTAQFHRSCPYLVPIYLERDKSETDEEYYKKLGFAKVNEDLNDFLKRMGGAARLYFAMMITRRRKGTMGKPLPLTAADGWKWIASILNEEPRSDITATLLFDALDVIGNLLLQSYRRQFSKVLLFIKEVYLGRIEKVTHGGMGPVARLREFVTTSASQGRIAVPQGVLPPNFW